VLIIIIIVRFVRYSFCMWG